MNKLKTFHWWWSDYDGIAKNGENVRKRTERFIFKIIERADGKIKGIGNVVNRFWRDAERERFEGRWALYGIIADHVGTDSTHTYTVSTRWVQQCKVIWKFRKVSDLKSRTSIGIHCALLISQRLLRPCRCFKIVSMWSSVVEQWPGGTSC